MSMIKVISCALMSCLLFTSCVSHKKYAQLEADLRDCKSKYKKLDMPNLDGKLSEEDCAQLQSLYKLQVKTNEQQHVYNIKLEKELDYLIAEYNALIDHSDNQLENHIYNRQDLERQIREKEKNYNYAADSYNYSSNGDLQAREAQLHELEMRLYNKEINLKEFETYLKQKERDLENLGVSIDRDFLNRYPNDVEMIRKEGKLYLSLSHQLLFQTGSSSVNSKGKSVLKRLAAILKANPNMNIVVQGHTDSSGSDSKNWDLSVQRAANVVKLLVSYGANPKSITAAGRSSYDPVLPNNSTANKSKNRRTEIIFTPKAKVDYGFLND